MCDSVKEENITFNPIRRPESAKKREIMHQELRLEQLVPFKDHPFKTYEGDRLELMVKDIHEHGVLVPIIVRPTKQAGIFEILSGHNRVKAAKIVGLETVQAVIYYGLAEADAKLIVTATNIFQRSTTDLKLSEFAVAITAHYMATIEKSGNCSDVIDEIEKMEKVPVGHHSKSRDIIAEIYHKGRTSILRYIHITRLIDPLKERLDNNKLQKRVADDLSFLTKDEQEIIEKYLCDGKKIDMKKSELIKDLSQNGDFNEDAVLEILGAQKIKQRPPLKLDKKLYSRFFKPEQTTEEINDILAKALEQYFKNDSV